MGPQAVRTRAVVSGLLLTAFDGTLAPLSWPGTLPGNPSDSVCPASLVHFGDRPSLSRVWGDHVRLGLPGWPSWPMQPSG